VILIGIGGRRRRRRSVGGRRRGGHYLNSKEILCLSILKFLN
jgi:hypothetical protein